MSFEIINPATTKELFSAVKNLKNKSFRFAAGCTDLLLELKKNSVENLTVINVAQIKDAGFTGIKKSAKGIQIGARVTAHSIVTNEEIKRNFLVLHEAALNLASTQIRQVATVGGNLCTASPSGDIGCALMALNANCKIMNETGKKRTISIRDFFTGVRKTAMKKGELLYTISIPSNQKSRNKLFSRFIKIGTRKSMECSVVSLAYHIQTDEIEKIIQAGIAIGASAPTIRFATAACDFIKGKNIFKFSMSDTKKFADNILNYASPISDIRATAWYRKEVLYNISKAIFEDIPANEK